MTVPPVRPGSRHTGPKVVEVVGPPGTGKSTLIEAMVSAGDTRMRRARLRDGASLSRLMRSMFVVLRPFLHQCRQMGKRRWNRLSLMVQLEAFDESLARIEPSDSTVVLLDQGPVYMLSILQRAFPEEGRAGGGSRVFRDYWDRTLTVWSHRLDHVIVLDAPDDVLYRRVQERPSEHKVKRLSQREASAVFTQSRSSTEPILKLLGDRSTPPVVLRFRTDGTSVGDLARRALEKIGAKSTLGSSR